LHRLVGGMSQRGILPHDPLYQKVSGAYKQLHSQAMELAQHKLQIGCREEARTLSLLLPPQVTSEFNSGQCRFRQVGPEAEGAIKV
jgi:hypothetical protein